MTTSPKIMSFLLVAATAILDQSTKYLALMLHSAHGDVNLLDGAVHFTVIYNRLGFLGAAAPLGETWRFLLLTWGVALLLAGCLYYLWRHSRRSCHHTLAIGLITGGGLGNLIDRLVHQGGVIDFLSIGYGAVRTGIFNFGDMAVLGGSCWLGFLLFRKL